MRNSNFGLYGLAMMISDSSNYNYMEDSSHSEVNIHNVLGIPKEKICPKGCTRYYFDSKGIRCREEDHVIYFDALTYERAKVKFDKWLKKLKNLVK